LSFEKHPIRDADVIGTGRKAKMTVSDSARAHDDLPAVGQVDPQNTP